MAVLTARRLGILALGVIVVGLLVWALIFYLTYVRIWDNVHALVEGGHTWRLEQLLGDQPLLANKKGVGGFAPLHVVCVAPAANQRQLVVILVEHGARINTIDDIGGSALHWAAEAGQYEAVNELLAQGAETTAKDLTGLTAAEMADDYGFPAIAQLIEGAAD